MKIGINPDFEVAEGRGRTNIFSFGNLMEFAIASTAVDLGMAPNLIRTALEQIHSMDFNSGTQFFNSEAKKSREVFFHVASSLGTTFTCFSGNIVDEYKLPRSFRSADNFIEKDDFSTFNAPGMIQKQMERWSTNALYHAKGYITLNLYEIKKDVLARL